MVNVLCTAVDGERTQRAISERSMTCMVNVLLCGQVYHGSDLQPGL